MPENKIVIVYHSQQAGNTRAAAELVAKGVREGGAFEVVLANTNDGRVDPRILGGCVGAAFGTPDYYSYPAGGMKQFMDDWLFLKEAGKEQISGMPVALFITHGGGGKAQKPHEELFRRIGPQVGKTVSVRGRPEGKDAEACVALGRELARAAQRHVGQKR